MKKITDFLVLLMFTATLALAQTKAPKWISDKCTAMKEQIKTDLTLTAEDADAYYQIILDKFSTDSEEIKKIETDEAKKEYRTKSSKEFGARLKEKFGAEKGQAMQKWTSENQAKFNNKTK